MDKIRTSSPAKVNITLDVIQKDPSGYHHIRSIVMPISLADTIEIQKAKKTGIALVTKGLACPQGKNNIVYQAAHLFFEAVQQESSIRIHLQKRIPLTAGLGGGSSNAATTLLGLNALYGAPLSQNQLTHIAKKLGTEVVYFLAPQLALVTHYGEKITPIRRKNSKLPEITLLMPKTKKHSTKRQYESLDLASCGKQVSKTNHLLRLLKTSEKTWDDSWNDLLHNDFEQLYRHKKNPKSHLSGSGPMRFIMHS